MNNSIEVSVAQITDLTEIKKLIDSGEKFHRINLPTVFKKIDSRKLIYDYYENIINKRNLSIAKVDNLIIGFLAIYEGKSKKSPIFVNKEYIVVDNIVVLENFRGKGVATKLLLYLESELQKREINEIELNVYNFNKSALKLYIKMGYSIKQSTMTKTISSYKRKNINQIIDNYTYKIINETDFGIFFNDNRSLIFKKDIDFNLYEILSDDEKEHLKKLSKYTKEMYSLYIGIFYQEKQIGWLYGRQESSEKFYMVNTGIFEEHQNKGIYTALLPKILSILKKKGFQVVYSRHKMTNNQVIISKLKQGFIISGFEISDVFGSLVHLSYYFNLERKDVIRFRTGEKRLNDSLKKHINL